MNEVNFETLILPEEIYKRCLSLSVYMFIFSVVALIIANKFFKIPIKTQIVWYTYIPKIIISSLAVLLTFCYDYSEKKLVFFHLDNMLVTTFLVGILGVIEILTTITSIIKDIIDMND